MLFHCCLRIVFINNIAEAASVAYLRELQRDYELETTTTTTTDTVLYREHRGEFFFNETSSEIVPVGANATEPLAEDEDWAPILRKILLGFVLGLIIIATVVGNILVVLAVFLVKKLRKPCNYLLVSLAVSDLCVAWLVMPLAMMYEIMGSWTFGSRACEVWVSFDVLSCTASILNLCMISVDRYYAISKPLEYGVKRTTRRMTFYTALVWIGAACVSLPPLLVLGNEYKVMKDYGAAQCGVSQNFYYQIYATIGAFYLPLCIMVTTYLRIFILARGIVIAEIRAQTHMDALCYVEVPTTATTTTTTTSTSSRRAAAAHATSGISDQEDRSAYEKATTTTTTDGDSMQSTAKSSIDGPLDQQPGCSRWHAPTDHHHHHHHHHSHQHHQQYQRALDGPVAVATAPAVVVVVPQAQPPRNILDGARQRSTAAVAAAQKAKSSSASKSGGGNSGSGSGCAGYCDGKKSFLGIHLSKEQKASTTLGIIMSAFVICWLPFFILALVRIFLDDPSLIPDELSSACIWLGYCNSLLNPIIYVTLNRDFRKPFRAILCFRCGDLRNMTREEFYKNHYGKTAMMSYGRSAATADIDTDKGYAAARNARVNAALNQQQLLSGREGETSRFTPKSTVTTTTTSATSATSATTTTTSSTTVVGRGTTSVTVDVEPSPNTSSGLAAGRVQESSV